MICLYVCVCFKGFLWGLAEGVGDTLFSASGICVSSVCNFRKILDHYYFKYFFLFSLCSLSGVKIMYMLYLLILSYGSWIFHSFFFFSFVFLCISVWHVSLILSASTLILFLVMSSFLMNSPDKFYFCNCVYFYFLFLTFLLDSLSFHLSAYIIHLFLPLLDMSLSGY